MPDPIVILDTIESSRVDDGLQGMQIFRGVTVKDIIFDVGQSPAEVWAKCLLAPGMPAKGSLMSASYPAILTNRRLAGIRQFNKTVRGELIYQAPPTFDGGTTINYTIVDAFQTAHILTSSTADGSENLYTLYKKGGDVHSAMTDTDAKAYPFEATKMVTFRSIRALGYATGTQWNAVKAGVSRCGRKAQQHALGHASARLVGVSRSDHEDAGRGTELRDSTGLRARRQGPPLLPDRILQGHPRPAAR
jgi:hypothetical protein